MAENIRLPASASNKIIDTFVRTEGSDEVHMQSVVLVDPTTGSPLATPDNITVASVSALNGDLFSIDASLYSFISLQLTGTWVGTVSFQCSNDNTNWVACAALISAIGGYVSNSTANALFHIVSPAKYLRARVTAYTSGTIVPIAIGSHVPIVFGPGTVTLSAATALAADVSLGVRTTSSNAASRQRVVSAASTNATSVKASAGRVYGWFFANTTGAAKFVKLYNKASAPTVGTDTPTDTIVVPPNNSVVVMIPFGVSFGTGIALAITGAYADGDTTAVAAGDVIGGLIYA